jgi:hypothetical protein
MNRRGDCRIPHPYHSLVSCQDGSEPVFASGTFQAHTDFANTWANALLGADLDPANPRYPVAKLAALDLAAMRVLVVSSGGALVGAYDYFLGDLRVARSSPYASAIQRTIEGLREDLARQVVDLASAVKAAEATAAEEVPTYRGGLINP